MRLMVERRVKKESRNKLRLQHCFRPVPLRNNQLIQSWSGSWKNSTRNPLLMGSSIICTLFLIKLFLIFSRYGVVLNKLNKKQEALERLKQAVLLYPLNWSAWMEIITCCTNFTTLEKVISGVPDSIVKKMFLTHAAIEFDYTPTETTIPQMLEQLAGQFPNSIYLQTREGIYYYHQRRTRSFQNS